MSPDANVQIIETDSDNNNLSLVKESIEEPEREERETIPTGEKKDPPSLEPSTMETVLSEESEEMYDYKNQRLSAEIEKKLEADVDNIANYIDIKKVVGKNESNYYYTPKNRATRKKVEKIKKKKGRSEEVDNLDTSQHTKLNLLDGCSDRSSYFGPTPTMKNGAPVEGVLKNRAFFIRKQSFLSTKSENDLSRRGSDISGSKSVQLATVHIREHERIAGDNPCVSSGVPLSIGWGHVQHEPIPLDDYEKAKGPPRDKIEMMVPAGVRKTMLRDEFKVSIADLNASMKSVNIAKKQRRHTVASEHMEGWHEVSESVKRKFKRMVNKSSTQKEEAAMWEQAHKSATATFVKKFGADALEKAYPELATGSGEVPSEVSIKADESDE